MCENKAALTWPSACPIFASTELTVEALTDLLQKRRFPTLGSRSTENSDADLSESKCVFSSLISQLTSWLVVGDVSPVLFCRLVEGVVRGNMALFEEDAFKSLLRAVLGVAADASSSSVELRQASAAAIACLLYLHSVDYKAALGARQRPLLHTTKHSDLLLSGGDRQLAEETLDCLIKLLEDANVDDPITELSCVHALMQLLCHRKFRVVGSRDHQPILERLRVVKVTTALWVSVCSVRKPQPPPAGRQADNAPYFSSSGFSSSGETSDVGGGDCGPPDPDAGAGSRVSQNQKKTRLLATFCLRHLLATSKKICQEVWPILMPEPAVPSSPSARAGKRAFQPDLVTIILKEGDYKLREIFIIMLWTLLNSMDKRFSVAEELSTWQSASFIPYSVKLAAELRSLHRRLAWALLSEKSHRHQLALLKVINALVTTTPYHRLRPGLLSDLVPTLNTVFFRPSDEPSKTALVKASILNIWSTILSKPTILEIHQLLIAKPSKSMSSSKVFEHWKDSKPDAPADVVSGVGPLNNILSRRFADSFSTCWLVELCLRLIHPKVADLAWDAGTADSNGPAAASPREAPQPNALRVQAISTLRAFVAVYYDCLRPSMHLLKRTIHLCLQPDMEENKPLRTDVFRLCDALISKVFESLITDLHSRLPAPQGVELSSKGDDVKLSSDCDSSLKTNVAWWTDIIAVILDNTTANTEGSECWWACQVIESFFELQSILSTDDSLADLCVRAISLFTDLCRERRDGVEAKALRKLCSLAILEYVDELGTLTSILEAPLFTPTSFLKQSIP
uniref:DUF4042 domain-containing protein n=1 Tax=Mesocestoides corti TaxID=53468 RepID=A0A5K3FH38_MESCO